MHFFSKEVFSLSITIKDVAKRAGVSVTTVSRFMNGRGYISAETQRNILRAINELNYTPNQLARSLFLAKTKMIGFVIPSLINPFFAELTQLIEQKLYDAGFHMLLCTTFGNTDRESDILNILRQHRVEAIIIGSPTLSDQEYHKADVPIIALDTLIPSAATSLRANHHLGGKLAAQRLIQGGCTRALQIIGNPLAHTDAQLRHQSFLQEMSCAGIPCISVPIPAEHDYDKAFQSSIIQSIFKLYPGVDGYFSTDLYALEILKYALQLGLSVPDDLQVIAYDGSSLTNVSFPQLTIIRQPYESLAESIVDATCRLVTGGTVESQIIFDNITLIDGQTTRTVRTPVIR